MAVNFIGYFWKRVKSTHQKKSLNQNEQVNMFITADILQLRQNFNTYSYRRDIAMGVKFCFGISSDVFFLAIFYFQLSLFYGANE